jgi:hypothetical protein
MLLNLKAVKINQREVNEIHERLSNWDKLHRDVVADPPSIEGLVKMLYVEVTTRQRLIIANRLLGMYHRQAREANGAHVIQMLAKG